MAEGFINHFITLLRNNRVLKNAGDAPCGDDFFVDPRHITLDVPSEIQTVLDTLFGTEPERCYFNVRMFTLLQALHSTEFVKTVLDKFPLITYDMDSTAFIDAGFGTSQTIASLPNEAPLVTLTVLGDLLPDHGLGRLNESWLIKVTDDPGSILWGGEYPSPWGGDNLPVEITNTLDGSSVLFSADDRQFPLHSISFRDTLLQVLFTTSASELPSGSYTVSSLARPAEDLADIEQRVRDLGPRILNELNKSSAEVELGMRLFFQHDQLVYRMAGLLITLFYKLEELREGAKFIFEVLPQVVELPEVVIPAPTGFVIGRDGIGAGFVIGTNTGNITPPTAPSGFVIGRNIGNVNPPAAPVGFVIGEDT